MSKGALVRRGAGRLEFGRGARRGAAAFVMVLLTSIGLSAGEIGTKAEREALFESIVEKTLRREAVSEIKNQRLGLDIEQAMRRYRDDVVDAEDEVELFYALVKVSSARRDKHLEVEAIEGGLSVVGAFNELARGMGYENYRGLRAPIRFTAGFSDPLQPTIFVSQIGEGIDELTGPHRVQVSDRVVSVNGFALAEFAERAKPYLPSSTDASFWYRLAQIAPVLSPMLPPGFYGDALELEIENAEGATFTVRLPYLKYNRLKWQRHEWRVYPGFQRREGFDFDSFRVYEPTGDQKVLLLQWIRFEDDLVEAVDALMEIAVREAWLDFDLIIDCTLSRGGSLGPYAIQHFSPHAFKTSFGNLRMSDVIPAFVVEEVDEYLEEGVPGDDWPASLDDGTWRVEWLTGDVLKGYQAGQTYSNNVPFKLAHGPSYSDGILQPAERHFRGELVCWFSPHGGSHLDQFSAIIHDNGLGYSIGMPTAGYSNTWEWEEDLTFPGSDRPVARFMWTIGHTIRPNGNVLEGNPADVDEWLPVTREDFLTYYETLVERSLAHLRKSREEPSSGASQ